MPIFEYVCRECDHHFEAIVLGSKAAHCPKCESKKLEQQLSRFAVQGKSSSESFGDSCSTGGPCGTCGDPDGPGACTAEDLD
ncbi:MAG TPA: zinc ribbon domain-containing protein [Candidatus Angelobacter sp.]|nr:zinc ribbon domain-containing protein [Candidatus Angelobacter sp.]